MSPDSLRPTPAGTLMPERRAAAGSLPAWYPPWARELADLYFSGTTCVFILYGNTHDLIYRPHGDDDRYQNLTEFLGTSLFGSWDVVLRYDLGHGLRPLAGSDQQRLQKMMHYVAGHLGQPANWPNKPDDVLPTLEALIERNLLELDADIFYAQVNLWRCNGWEQSCALGKLSEETVDLCLYLSNRLVEVSKDIGRETEQQALEL